MKKIVLLLLILLPISSFAENYVKTKVKWIDDCTYKLIHITSDILDLEKGTVTTCKILQTFENGYHGIGTSSFTEEAVPFTMYKID